MVRGALSDGYEWIFIILHLNENGKGGEHKMSREIRFKLNNDAPVHIEDLDPDIVAGILAHWVRHRLLFPAGHVHKCVTGAALLR